MEIKCEYIDKDSGCLVSFDGSCCKEECFTYRLLQLLQAKEQENERLLEIINAKPLETVDIDSAFEIEKLKEQLQAKGQECEELKQTLTEIKEVAKNFIKNVSDRCVETTPMYGVHKQILQEISESEVENER